MGQKYRRQIRKALNRQAKSREEISDQLVRELIEAPLKFRLKFCLGIIFRKKVK